MSRKLENVVTHCHAALLSYAVRLYFMNSVCEFYELILTWKIHHNRISSFHSHLSSWCGGGYFVSSPVVWGSTPNMGAFVCHRVVGKKVKWRKILNSTITNFLYQFGTLALREFSIVLYYSPSAPKTAEYQGVPVCGKHQFVS